MALRFTTPPNWPTPPEGFVPEAGWQPDPAWGPAPEGWNFWVDDAETASSLTNAEEIPFASSATADQVVQQSPEQLSDQQVQPESQIQQTNHLQPENNLPEEHHSPSTLLAEDPTEVFEPAEATRPLDSYQDAPQQSQQQPEADARTVKQASIPATAATYSNNQNQPGSFDQASGQNGQQAPYSQGSFAAPSNPLDPQQKKSKKLLWIILAAALVLLLGLGLAIFAIVKSISASSTTASSTSISQSQENSGGLSAPTGSKDFTRSNTSGETKTYEGTGNKTIDIEKPGGDNSTAWVEYSYTPTSQYDTLDINALNSSGDDSGSFVMVYSHSSATFTGSTFLDGHLIDSNKPTKKLEVKGKGSWKIVVHPLNDTPVKKAGDTISGTVSQAFIVEGNGTTANVKTGSSDLSRIRFSMAMEPDNIEDYVSTFFQSDYPGLSASISMPNGKHLYEAESLGGSSWEITLK